MNILKRTLAGLLVVFLAFGQVTSIPGIVDAILGASNITTAGACVYVSASGTLNQDSPGCHWDDTNNRLGLGTASPSIGHLHATGTVSSFSSIPANTAAIGHISQNGWSGSGFVFGTSANSAFSMVGVGNVAYFGRITGSAVAAQWFRVNDSGINIGASGNTATNRLDVEGGVSIGHSAVAAPTNGLIVNGITGIGPSNTSPTGTLHVYDATPATGVTTLTVRAAAAQSSTRLISQQRNTSATLGEHYSYEVGGAFIADVWSSDNANGVAVHTGGMQLASTALLQWRNGSVTAINSGSASLGLTLASANNLAVTNGSSTTYATIGADGIILNNGRFQIPTSTPASASTTCTAGTITWDTNFTYVCVATDTWKRAAMLTW